MMKKTIFMLAFLIVFSAIAYAAPEVKDVSITNTAPVYTTDNLICSFTLNSTTGEAVYGNVTWYKNSALHSSVQKGPVISESTVTDTMLGSETGKGDSWYCSVSAYNETASTAFVSSSTIVVANTNVTLKDLPDQTHVENETTPKTFDLTSMAIDPDGDSIIFSATSGSNVVCSISGSNLSFVPVMGFIGTDTCDITAYDGTHLTQAKPISINVNARNEAFSVESIPTIIIIKGNSGSVSETFKITNTGNVDISPITFLSTEITQQGNSSNFIPSSAVQINSGSPLSIDAGDNKDVDVAVTASTYAAGTYRGSVNITYGASTITKDLTLTIREQSAYLTVPSEVYLGDTSGQDRNEYVSGSFEITNSGSSGDKTLTNIEISDNANSKYNISFSIDDVTYESTVSGFSLSPGISKTIYFKGYIPNDTDSGLSDIGNIEVKSEEITKTISNFYTNAESKLTINDIEVEVDGSRDNSISVSGDDISKEAHPGSVVEIKIKVENEFSSSSNIKIEDVRITAKILDIEGDDDDDMEEETSTFSVRDNSKSEWKWLTFELPYDVEEGSYEIEIEVEGQDDEYGSEHTASTTLTLEVERESHDLKIMKASLGSEEIGCDDYTTLNVLVKNIGDDDEDEVVLTVKNSDLGLMYTSDNFELVEDPDDDDNEFSKIFTIDIRGKELSAGIYPIEIDAFYNEDVPADTKTVKLTVNSCKAEEIDEEEDTADETVVLEGGAEDIAEEGGAIAEGIYEADTVEEGFMSGDSYVILLLLANIIVIGAAVFLVFKFMLLKR